MKKIFKLMGIAACGFLLVSCGSQISSSGSQISSSTSTSGILDIQESELYSSSKSAESKSKIRNLIKEKANFSSDLTIKILSSDSSSNADGSILLTTTSSFISQYLPSDTTKYPGRLLDPTYPDYSLISVVPETETSTDTDTSSAISVSSPYAADSSDSSSSTSSSVSSYAYTIEADPNGTFGTTDSELTLDLTSNVYGKIQAKSVKSVAISADYSGFGIEHTDIYYVNGDYKDAGSSESNPYQLSKAYGGDAKLALTNLENAILDSLILDTDYISDYTISLSDDNGDAFSVDEDVLTAVQHANYEISDADGTEITSGVFYFELSDGTAPVLEDSDGKIIVSSSSSVDLDLASVDSVFTDGIYDTPSLDDLLKRAFDSKYKFSDAIVGDLADYEISVNHYGYPIFSVDDGNGNSITITDSSEEDQVKDLVAGNLKYEIYQNYGYRLQLDGFADDAEDKTTLNIFNKVGFGELGEDGDEIVYDVEEIAGVAFSDDELENITTLTGDLRGMYIPSGAFHWKSSHADDASTFLIVDSTTSLDYDSIDQITNVYLPFDVLKNNIDDTYQEICCIPNIYTDIPDGESIDHYLAHFGVNESAATYAGDWAVFVSVFGDEYESIYGSALNAEDIPE